MHLVIPFAAPLSDAGRQALSGLALPQLARRLAGMHERSRDEGDEWSLSTPHERAIARAQGWAGPDGGLPWAARELAALGHDPGALAWGLLTPVHWHLGTDQVSMGDPTALMLGDEESRAFFAAIEELYTSEGFVVLWGGPLAWFVAHESLGAMPCASLDRVIGRNVDRWLAATPEARLVRRLQNEVQMRLYEHPLNDARQARGLLPLNSVWLSGCGVAQPTQDGTLRVDDRLRHHALAEDWAGWCKAWDAVDASLADPSVEQITLCGERSSLTYGAAPRGLWQRLAANFRRVDTSSLLEPL
jgi:hypothetical protein